MEVTDQERPDITTPKINQDLGTNTQPSQQQWLKQQAQNTATTNQELWKNFPEGGSGPSPSTSNPRKDPLATFLNSPLSP